MRAVIILRFLLSAAALWFAAAASANACTGLGCTCSVTAQNVNFDRYDPIAVSPDTATGAVSVTCSALVAVFFTYDVKFSIGGAASYAARRMVSGANQINYQLYRDAAYATIWGDGSAGTGFAANSYTLSVPILTRTDNYSVYGRAPAQQNVKTGSYSDTITVTVTF